MISMVYLILVLHDENSYGLSMQVVQVPQANVKQCQVNSEYYKKDHLVKRAYCIVGVK